MAISVERFYAICRPLKVKIVCTFTGTAKIVSALWIIAASAVVPFSIITYTDEATFYDNSKVQVCRTHIRLPWQRIYVVLTIMTFFVVPLLVLLTLYTLICRQLVKQSGDPKTSSNPRTSLSLKLRRQVVIMLCIITSLFFLCLLPFKVVSLWTIYAPRQEIERLGLEGYLNLINFSRVMYYINSAINPVVYNLISTRFRNYFKHSITCGRLEPPAVLSRVSTWNNSRAGSRKSASSTSTCVSPWKHSPNTLRRLIIPTTQSTSVWYQYQKRMNSYKDWQMSKTSMHCRDQYFLLLGPVFIENIRVTPEWGCNPVSSNSIVFNENSTASVIAELPQHRLWCSV